MAELEPLDIWKFELREIREGQLVFDVPRAIFRQALDYVDMMSKGMITKYGGWKEGYNVNKLRGWIGERVFQSLLISMNIQHIYYDPIMSDIYGFKTEFHIGEHTFDVKTIPSYGDYMLVKKTAYDKQPSDYYVAVKLISDLSRSEVEALERSYFKVYRKDTPRPESPYKSVNILGFLAKHEVTTVEPRDWGFGLCYPHSIEKFVGARDGKALQKLLLECKIGIL